MDARCELALRSIVDTGSGASLVREELLTMEVKVAPAAEATANL